MASPAEIGVIVDSPLQRHVLQRVLSSYGLSVHLSCEPQNFEHQPAERIAEVDCWLVDIADEALEEPIIEALFDLDNKPVLFGLGQAPEKHDELYISWERRLIGKLQEHLGQIEQLESEESILPLASSARILSSLSSCSS